MAASRAKKKRELEEDAARKEAERREVERHTAELKAVWVPVFNQELSKVLGEQVELDWDWSVPMKVSNGTVVPIGPNDRPVFRTKIDPVYIEAHPMEGGRVMFRVAYGGSSGPLDSMEDLGDALLTYRPRS